jgi:hypothetical protein
VSSTGTTSDWPRLLRIASSLIRQANATGPAIGRWTLGGGTALMLRIDHRESRDIDVFFSDPQHLALLDPAKRDFDFEISPSGYTGDGARFLKLAFPGLGEIDFISAGLLTSPGATDEVVNGEALSLETTPEIIAKKIHFRGAAITPRDIFDIAAAGERDAETIVDALRGHKIAVGTAIGALEKLNPDFISGVISQLAIKSAYAPLARMARERAMDILRAV